MTFNAIIYNSHKITFKYNNKSEKLPSIHDSKSCFIDSSDCTIMNKNIVLKTGSKVDSLIKDLSTDLIKLNDILNSL